MDRSTRLASRSTVSALLLMGLALLLQSGCVNALATAAWMIKGNDEAAEFDGLKHKRVAVICRPLVELQYSAGSRSAQDLAIQVGTLLSQRVKKVTIVDPRKVAEWADEHEWEDYTEVGKALNADMVIGIDVEEFSLFQSQTLYQGKSRLTVSVYDVNDGKLVDQKQIPQVIFPPNRGVETTMPEEDFRRRFVSHLAEVVGRHFYSHESQSDIALDAKGFNSE